MTHSVTSFSPPGAKPHSVLVLNDSFDMGGVEKKLYQFITRLDSSQFRMTLCCTKEGGLFKEAFVRLGLPCYEHLLRHKYDAFAYRKLARIIRKHQVQTIYTFAHPSTLIFGTMARRFGSVEKLIVSFHASGSASGGLLLRGYQRYLLRTADTLVAVAESHKRYLVAVEKLDHRKIVVINNGVDTREYRPGPPNEVVREELGIRRGATVVATVASLKRLKNIHLLLEAAGEIAKDTDDVHYLIVGEGPDRGELEALASKLGIRDQVTFTGFREDVPDLLRLSHVFVLPSRTEVFSNAILEAMASGLAIVATDVGSSFELVRSGENGFLVPSEDPTALASALRELLGNPEMLRNFGQKSRRIVEAEYTLESMCERRARLFREVACKTP